jgi:hypothetical protein
MTIKDFWITIAIVAVLSFIIGIQLCRYNHKTEVPIIYDLEYLTDSILKANKTIDTVIIELEGEIKYEKGKLIEKFYAIDSLSYDSSYKLWQQSARQYKAYAN